MKISLQSLEAVSRIKNSVKKVDNQVKEKIKNHYVLLYFISIIFFTKNIKKNKKNKERAQNCYLYHQKGGKEKQYYEGNKKTSQKMVQDP